MQDARACLLELEKLASQSDGPGSEHALDRVTDLFFLTCNDHGAAERAVFGDVMERIASELETGARARLAERLAETGHAPHKILLKLAGDEITVARPVLQRSPCLTDDDLVRIANVSEQDHLHAITGRETLSPKVTDVIVERGNDAVLTSVAENEGAEFSDQGLKRLSVRAEESDELYSALTAREDVPEAVLSEIKRIVAARLKKEIAGKTTGLTGEDVDRIVDAKATQIKLDAKEDNPGDGLKRGRAITEDMVLGFARARKLEQSIKCLSLVSGVSQSRASHCLLNADLTALAVLCKASRFQNSTFAALIQLRSASQPLPARVISEAMRHYDMLDVETARNAIRNVRARADEREEPHSQ